MQEMFQELQEPEKQGCIRKTAAGCGIGCSLYQFMTVIDEHLEFIRMMVRENGVREFLSEEEVRSIWKNRIPWLPTLLKRKMEAGEVKEMDFEMGSPFRKFYSDALCDETRYRYRTQYTG